MQDLAQRIIDTSRAEARWRGHSQVTLDHLGFVIAHDPLCAAALSAAGVDLDEVRDVVGVRLAMRRHAARAASPGALLPTMGWVRLTQTLEGRDSSTRGRRAQEGAVALGVLDELLRRPRCAFATAVARQGADRDTLARMDPGEVRRAAIARCQTGSGRPVAAGYVRISVSVIAGPRAEKHRMAIADALVAALSTSPTDGHRLTESLRLSGDITSEQIPAPGVWPALLPFLEAARQLSVELNLRFDPPGE